jgi:TonB family protein
MEPIFHAHHQRRKRNTAKSNLTLSIILHVILFGFAAWWAANEGMLGKKMQELSVLLVPREKKADKPVEKKAEQKAAEEKKVEETKTTPTKTTATETTAKTTAPPPPPPPVIDTSTAPPPPPPAVDVGAFTFGEEVLTGKSSLDNYKGVIEKALLGRWQKPSEGDDLNYVVEIELALDASGNITSLDWKKSSGNPKWDDSVKKALNGVKALPSAPPKGFPAKFVVRFDVTTVGEE